MSCFRYLNLEDLTEKYKFVTAQLQNIRGMVTYLRILFCFIVILLFPYFIMAEESYLSFYNVNSCPPDVTIRSMMMDSRGFVWLGSDNYVYRFDGVHVAAYSLVSENSDKVVLVKDMVETPSGNIIVAADNGLFCMDMTSKGQIEVKPFMRDKITDVESLSLHPDGYLLIATSSSLWSYSFLRGTLSRILIDRDPLSRTNIPCAMASSPAGVEIIAEDGGIYLLEKNFRVKCIRKGASDFPLPKKAVKTGGDLYLATEANGLWKISADGAASRVEGVEANVVTSLSRHNDSTLFVGTDGVGVYELGLPSGKVRRQLMHRPGVVSSLRSNQIYSLLTDRENRLWVGHYQRGVDHTETMSPGIFLTMVNPDDKAVRTINILPNRNILVGTRLGMYVLSPGGSSVLKNISRPTLRSNMVISAAVAGDTIYAGTYGGGLSMLSATSGNLIGGSGPLPADMNAAHIFSICKEDASGGLWFGTSNGLFRSLNGVLTHFTSENSSLTKGNVYTVFFDSSGKGWVGTEDGLTIWDPALQKLRTDCFPEDFVSKAKIRQIYEGKDHTLYFVLENGKIALSNIDMSEFSRPEIFEKRNYIIKAVMEDRFGFVWLATNHGLIRWDRLSQLSVFGRDNGIPDNPFIHCLPAKENSVIMFGNACGMLSVNTDVLSKLVSQASLVPVMVTADGNLPVDNFASSEDGKEFVVRFEEYSRKVTLKISTMNFGEPDNLKYEYRINDGEWLSMPAGYTITLHNVDYGKTRIFMRPVDDDAAMSTIVVQMPGRVSPWVWIVVAVAVVAVIIYVVARKVKIRIEAMLRKNEEAEMEHLKKNDQDDGENKELYSQSERSKYATVGMSTKECEAIMKKINNILEKEKPYTNPNLKISDLARMADISSHKLSYVLSQHLNVGFYDLINQYRIAEFKRIVDSGADQTLTLTAMSERAGFSSRSSFFRCFKKLEGITPGEYLKRNTGH